MATALGTPDDGEESSTPSEDELRGVCEHLLCSWVETFSGVDSINLGREDQSPDDVRFSIVLAFAAHAYHVTTAAADLMHADDYLSAIPLLRLGYESALTAAWAAHSEDAARALQNQYVETAQKLHGSVTKTGWFDGLLPSEVASELVDAASSARGEAASFANLCLALAPHGEWLYTMYRLLSAYSHPSGTVLASFVPGDVSDGVTLNPETPTDSRSWWHAAATNLLHAGQALDRLDPDKRRNHVLSEAGDTIGWTEPLRLTESAAKKVVTARMGRRQQGSTPAVP